MPVLASSFNISRPAPAIRGMLATTLAVMLGTFVAVLAAGGTYALWNDQVAISPTTISSGTVGLTVTQADGMNVTGLVPGAAVATTFTAANVGDVDLSVAVTSTTLASQTLDLASHLSITLAPVADSAACSTAVAGGVQGALLGFTSTTSPVLIDQHASQLYCLVASLSPSAPPEVQGGTAAFVLNFEGQQVAS